MSPGPSRPPAKGHVAEPNRDPSGMPRGAPGTDLFSAVVGQPAAVAALASAARQPVHAYLLTGIPGAGPRAAVPPFAAALLCPRGGCGICPHCQRALAGTHPDLIVVDRTGAALGVDEARRVTALSVRRPREAARQVLVVTDLHLAVRSVPALLKTIEEPPPSTVFVLLADHVPPELATLSSRCVEVPFPPLTPAVIAAALEARQVDPRVAEAVALGAGGDLDRAQLLAGDPGYAARVALWHSIPGRLDGYGATAAGLARQVLESLDAALGPLQARQADEIRQLEAEARAMGERGLPGRREITDHHHREERRYRTDELRAGLGVLARAYRDRLAGALGRPDQAGLRAVAAGEQAVGLVTRAAADLRRNPRDTLLLEALFVRLAALDA